MSSEITVPATDVLGAASPPPAEQMRRNAPAKVVNGTRVTIAFPFSHLSVSDTTREVRALAQLVAELADALVDAPDEDAAEALRQRAHDLRDALGATAP